MEKTLLQKTVELNRLIIKCYPDTTILTEELLKSAINSYNGNTYMILDSFIFNCLGIYYKDYVDFLPAPKFQDRISFNPMRFEQVVDRRLSYYQEFARN